MGRTTAELRGDIEQRRMDLTQDFEALGDRVSPARAVERRTEAVKGSLRTARERVMGTADDVTGTVHDRAGDARGSLQDAAHSVNESVQGVPGAVRHQTQGNPLAAGLVAFGFGLLAATVLPGTRRERDLARQMQPQLERAARAAGAAASDVVEDVKPALQESIDELQGSARDAVARVTDEAKDAASGVGDEAKQAAGNVRDAAS